MCHRKVLNLHTVLPQVQTGPMGLLNWGSGEFGTSSPGVVLATSLVSRNCRRARDSGPCCLDAPASIFF